MDKTRIYFDGELRPGSSISLEDNLYRHVSTVLRMKAGDSLTLFNGDGRDSSALIEAVDKKRLIVHIDDKVAVDNESPVYTHLFQAISKGDRMDTALQKSVELGVSEITPIITARTVVRLDSKKSEKKIEHWQRVVISACEQSGRAIVPRVNHVVTLDEAMKSIQPEVSYILTPTANTGLSSISTELDRLNLFIGPEGGFSDSEIELAEARGMHSVGLGKRIIRTETAPIAALSVIQTIAGDY